MFVVSICTLYQSSCFVVSLKPTLYMSYHVFVCVCVWLVSAKSCSWYCDLLIYTNSSICKQVRCQPVGEHCIVAFRHSFQCVDLIFYSCLHFHYLGFLFGKRLVFYCHTCTHFFYLLTVALVARLRASSGHHYWFARLSCACSSSCIHEDSDLIDATSVWHWLPHADGFS